MQATLKTLVADGLVLRRDKPGGNGLQEYALVRMDLVRGLPRFADALRPYRGRFIHVDGNSVEVTL